MLKFLSLMVVIMVFLVSACVPASNTPAVDYPATIAVISVNATLGAIEHAGVSATLSALASQPTPTCPVCEAPPTALPPTATPVPPTPTHTSVPVGGIAGRLSYPSDHIPRLRIIAFNIVTGEYYWQNTIVNQTYYRFSDLPVATYHVLAYLIENPSDTLRAAYSQAVPCGLTAACSDHSLINVTVVAGQVFQNADVTDWYSTNPAADGWPVDPTISH